MFLPHLQTKGFTLVETLVAISILLVVTVGPMTVAQKGVRSAYFANEQVTAIFLAQEAIEAVRMYRDSRAISAYNSGYINNNPTVDTGSWVQLLPVDCDPDTNSSGCAYINGTFQTCSSNGDCRIQYSSATGKYEHNTGLSDSLFTRRVFINPDGNGNAAVTVRVSWTSSLVDAKEIALQTWIYDHYQRFGT
jgi:prepilin-type N-terminal cleavage/methylation domain-containing protein